MTQFDGFSDISLLYAEKHELVKAMKKQFEDEREALFVILQDSIESQAWYRPDSVYRSGGYLDIKLLSDARSERILLIQFWLAESDVADRVFRSGLQIEDKKLKREFRREASEFLRTQFNAKDYQSLGKSTNKTILYHRVSFEDRDILAEMLAEVERLRALLPYAEKVYQQSANG